MNSLKSMGALREISLSKRAQLKQVEDTTNFVRTRISVMTKMVNSLKKLGVKANKEQKWDIGFQGEIRDYRDKVCQQAYKMNDIKSEEKQEKRNEMVLQSMILPTITVEEKMPVDQEKEEKLDEEEIPETIVEPQSNGEYTNCPLVVALWAKRDLSVLISVYEPLKYFQKYCQSINKFI